MLKRKGAVAFRADVSDERADDPAVVFMEQLGNKYHDLPFLAVFPAGRPDEPILLRTNVTGQSVLAAVQQCPDRP